MLVHSPEWVAHRTGKDRKTPIYSLHVHPDGKRLATAGLVNIKIWSIEPIKSVQAETDAALPKLLSTLSIHDGAILCVRWSPSGEFLASGSEDAKVVVWKLDPSTIRNAAFGDPTSTKNVESYRVVKILPAHESDVADIAWSPDGTFLASCSFDRRIAIWDANTFKLIKTIDSHAGFVKGLTWDPAGKYLASQSDDRSIKVFRVSDWEAEVTITDPFASGASSSFFTRLSWSPNGVSIAATNSESGSVCVAPIIQRQDWKADTFLVGHKAAIEVARYNPVLFIPTGGDTATQVVVCATGSQDNGISVWMTNSPYALVNLVEVVDHSVLDLSWTPDGYGLFGCSFDGTVVYIQFELSELGRAYTAQETESMLGKYGKGKSKVIIPETVSQLDLEAQPLSLLQIDSMQDVDMVSDSIPDHSMLAMGAKGTGTRNAVDIVSGTTMMVDPPTVPAKQATKSTNPLPKVAEASSTSPPKTIQTETRTKDGKKRIQPMFIQSLDGTVPDTQSMQPATATLNTSRVQQNTEVIATAAAATAATAVTAAVTATGPKTQTAHAQPSTASTMNQTMMAHAASKLPGDGIPARINRSTPAAVSLSSSSSSQATPLSAVPEASTATDLRPTKYVLPIVNSFESLPQLGIPDLRSIVIVQAKDAMGSRLDLKCENSTQGSRVTCFIGDKTLWEIKLPTQALLAVAGKQFIAIGGANASLQILSLGGRRILPAIALPSATAFLAAQDDYLLCIDGVGQVFVWDMAKCKQLISHVSISPILQDDDGEEDIRVTITHATMRQDTGAPILTTSQNKTFVYSLDMHVWMHLISSDLQRIDHGYITDPHFAAGQKRRFPSLEQIEEMMVSSVASGASKEYRYWLVMYARRLASESELVKGKELCDELTGTGLHMTRGNWVDTVLSFKKRDLFKELMPILGANRIFQRVISEATEALRLELDLEVANRAVPIAAAGSSSSSLSVALATEMQE